MQETDVTLHFNPWQHLKLAVAFAVIVGFS